MTAVSPEQVTPGRQALRMFLRNKAAVFGVFLLSGIVLLLLGGMGFSRSACVQQSPVYTPIGERSEPRFLQWVRSLDPEFREPGVNELGLNCSR